MIKKFLEIDNLGIFKDFRWNSYLPEFKKFNLIYGLNGSGKTTLTHLFSALESVQSIDYLDLKYQIETESGEYSQDMKYPRKIKVFNKQYVSKNINFFECKTEPIIILGEENKLLAEQIIQYNITLTEKKQLLEESEDKFTKKERVLSNILTNVARTISSIPSGVATRRYYKPDARGDFDNLDGPSLLPENDQRKYRIILQQQKIMGINEIIYRGSEEVVASLLSNANLLQESTAETVIIKRLKDNPDISQWVEAGYQLHLDKNSCVCEFCNQPLPEERIQELAAYFNEADKQLKAAIDELLEEINQICLEIENIQPPDKANFYSDLQMEYQASVDLFSTEKKHLLNEFETLKKEVKDKKLHTTEELLLKTSIDMRGFLSALNDVNTNIKYHNEKTHNFEEKRKEAEEKLKTHYLSEIWDEVEKLDFEIIELRKIIKELKNGDPDNPDFLSIAQVKNRIAEYSEMLSKSRLACDKLNQKIADFLGRSELIFELEEEGYIIKHHHGKKAKNLSEGEKNAIAFVYFTISLEEENFDLEDGIVVIDDPVSSLDSNSLFQAFVFLKHAVQNAHQVFILTHNYDFLRLILDWFKYIKDNPDGKAFYMINNFVTDNTRKASIRDLDELLLRYDTEYQYLFKLLYTFHKDDTKENTIETVYHLPNIARKVLEHFLMIVKPNNEKNHVKLKDIDYCSHRKDAIYKFVNEQSHYSGKDFNPSLVSETSNCIYYLLDMIKTVLPDHYDCLTKLIN